MVDCKFVKKHAIRILDTQVEIHRFIKEVHMWLSLKGVGEEVAALRRALMDCGVAAEADPVPIRKNQATKLEELPDWTIFQNMLEVMMAEIHTALVFALKTSAFVGLEVEVLGRWDPIQWFRCLDVFLETEGQVKVLILLVQPLSTQRGEGVELLTSMSTQRLLAEAIMSVGLAPKATQQLLLAGQTLVLAVVDRVLVIIIMERQEQALTV